MVALVTLAVTALASSRTLFYFFHDSEGPNLLIVSVLAAIVYGISLVAYRFTSSFAEYKRVAIAILVQLLILASLYFSLT